MEYTCDRAGGKIALDEQHLSTVEEASKPASKPASQQAAGALLAGVLSATLLGRAGSSQFGQGILLG